MPASARAVAGQQATTAAVSSTPATLPLVFGNMAESYHRLAGGELHLSVSHRVVAVSCSALLYAGLVLPTRPVHTETAVSVSPVLVRPGSCAADIDWAAYNGNVDGQHYSALALINRTNVAQLKVAWQFDTEKKAISKPTPRRRTCPLRLYVHRESHRAQRANGSLLWTLTRESKTASLHEALRTGRMARTPGFLRAC